MEARDAASVEPASSRLAVCSIRTVRLRVRSRALQARKMGSTPIRFATFFGRQSRRGLGAVLKTDGAARLGVRLYLPSAKHYPRSSADRAADYESAGRRFKSCRGCQLATRLQYGPIGPHTDRTGNGGVDPKRRERCSVVPLPFLLRGKGFFSAARGRGFFGALA